MQTELKPNDVIFWRWKKDGKGYIEDTVVDVNGNFITFDEPYRYSRTWIDVVEIDFDRRKE